MSLANIEDYGYYYYLRDNMPVVFYNKFQGCMSAEQDHQFLHWNFNDEFFSKFDWSIEPSEPITTLYQQRAKELRSKYDYLVLHYSGGWDSGNILQSFLDANIEIDEIILRGAIPDKINKNDLSAKNCYAEVFLAGLPRAKEAKEKWPNLRITIKDTKQLCVDTLANNAEWFYDVNTVHVGVFRNDLDILSEVGCHLAENGKKVCHIIGIDKPRIYHNGTNYQWKFLDGLIINHINPRLTDIDRPYYIEFFYWAPTLAATKIMIKQAHIMKQYFKAHNLHPNDIDYASRPFQDLTARLIYPNYSGPLWTSDKAHSMAPEWDYWFYNDPNTPQYKNWMNGLKYIESIIPKKYRNTGSIVDTGLVGFWSGDYNLGI